MSSIYSHFQSFSAIFSHYQPLTAISWHSSHFQPFPAIPAISSLFQPIPAYSSLIQPFLVYSSQFHNILVYSCLFHPHIHHDRIVCPSQEQSLYRWISLTRRGRNARPVSQSVPRPIQSISCILSMDILSSVPSDGERNWENGESWRLLVKDRIAKIAKLRTLLLKGFDYFWGFKPTNVFWGFVFVNQPNVHSGGVSRGRVCGCVCCH